jgi:hypothetical protein
LVCVVLTFACGKDKQSSDTDSGERIVDAAVEQFEDEKEPLTEKQFVEFSYELTFWTSSIFVPPKNADEMASSSTFVLSGEFLAVTPGRKEFIGLGCDDINFDPAEPGSEDEVCQGNPNAMIYASYVNLVVRPDKIAKGSLERPESNVHLESPWPNNVEIDKLTNAAPTGIRVIVIGDPVTDARELAKPLEEEGIVSPNSVADNLLMVPPWGFIIEALDGTAIMPFLQNQALNELIEEDSEDLSSFDGALQTILDTADQ